MSTTSESGRRDSGSREAAPEVQQQSLGTSIPALLDERMKRVLDRRKDAPVFRRRGWLVRRMLLAGDVIGLFAAFVAGETLVSEAGANNIPGWGEWAIFAAVIPLWIIGAKLFGLYEQDEERTDHSTADDLARVLLLATLGAFLLTRVLSPTALKPSEARVTVFWAAAIVFVVLARVLARVAARRSVTYLQNAVIVGAGEVGQIVARKLLQHKEYGINLVGFVDAEPRERWTDLEHLAIIGPPEWLPEIVTAFDVERVIVAFSNDSHQELLNVIRLLRDHGVQIDVVPRLFEVVGPRVAIHTLEGLPLVGLPPVKLTPSSRFVKRALDLVCSATMLLLTAPIFAVIALRIKLDSKGPVFFRQTRLGMGMKEFTALKFRTMHTGTSDAAHREFVRASMDYRTAPLESGLYKLDRADAITPFGRLLRRTSLDELPQLINVLRGDMSLVGPRPCLPYELEHFAPHHFERFLVPAGLTGLWQVTARAKSSFGEALDMDVAYARGWSLGLDLQLLWRTPRQLVHSSGTR